MTSHKKPINFERYCIIAWKKYLNNNMLPELNITFTRCERDCGSTVCSGKGCQDAIELAEQPL